MTKLASTETLLEELKSGRCIVLVDEEDRENEGDLLIAADFATPEAINFMAKHGRGLICLTLKQEHCRQLNLPLMAQNNKSRYGTAFTVSIEAAHGVTTGISAADRSRTVQAAIAKNASSQDIVSPGHIFPIMAQPGGVLVRAGHTEAGCDLTHLAGLTPAAVICEIMKDDGTMARLPELMIFAQQHGLQIGTIADLIRYRSRTESIIERLSARFIETHYGKFHAVHYRDKPNGQSHLALVYGSPEADKETLVRVHEPVSVLDLLDLNQIGHSWTIPAAMQEIVAQQCGVLILLNCLHHDLDSVMNPMNHEEGAIEQPQRPSNFCTYGVGAQILCDLGVRKMRLLSHPYRMPHLAAYGLEVCGFKLMS